MMSVGVPSGVSAWKRKGRRPGVIATIGPVPELSSAGNQQPTMDISADFAARGERTPRPGLSTHWVCYDRPDGKVRTFLQFNPEPGRRTWVASRGQTPRPRDQGRNIVPRACRLWQGPAMALVQPPGARRPGPRDGDPTCPASSIDHQPRAGQGVRPVLPELSTGASTRPLRRGTGTAARLLERELYGRTGVSAESGAGPPMG